MTWLTKQCPRICLLITFLAAPQSFGSATESCDKTAGRQQARRFVEQCLKVSPATHPPCHPANACALIQDEIQRGCALLGSDAPDFCRLDHQSDPVKPRP